MAIIASPTGTARMPTQGSWRPLVTMSTSSPERVTPFTGPRIDEVGFTAKRADDRLAGGDAAEHAAGIVGEEHRPPVVARAHLVGVLLAADFCGLEAVADLHALHRVDRHEGRGDVLVELAVDRRAEPGGTPSACTSITAPTDEPALRTSSR